MEDIAFFKSIIDFFNSLLNTINKIFDNKKEKKKTSEPYYFEEHNKKVFVRSNGDGVIVCFLAVHINDPTKVSLIRTVDISDAKKGCVFPDFDIMLHNGATNPFNEFGLWYTSDSDIITSVEKFYDSRDTGRKNDRRFISFKLNLNESNLEKGKTYGITYALSIPGLYPINNGRFDGTVGEHKNYGNFETSIYSYNNLYKHLTYSVYAECDIVFQTKPIAAYIGPSTNGEAQKQPCTYRNNMFYEKFSFTLDNPQKYDRIYMQWDLKNQMSVPKKSKH